MPQTFRVSVAGGIDAVTDTAFGDGKHVAYMENLDVRGGKAVPVHLPLVNPAVSVPTGSVQVFSYRSRLIFSSLRRDYAAEYLDSRERIYWTQYGGNPQKMIEGVTVPLGTTPPLVPPGVTTGTYVSPQSINITVGAGGSIPQYTNLTFRLAYQTAFGILPPSGIIQPTVNIAGAMITLTWSNAVMDTPANAIIVFLGTVGGDERYLATLGPKESVYVYSAPMTAFGDLASNYDQQDNYTYCTTYLRNVNGVEDESGPSSPSPSVASANSRSVSVSPWSEGLLNSSNIIPWTAPFKLVDINSLPGTSSNPLTVASITQETGTNKILCTFTGNHYFVNNERIFIHGITPTDPFGGLPVQVIVQAPTISNQSPVPNYQSVYLSVGTGFTYTGTSLSGVTAYRVPQVGISILNYNAEAGVIVIMTTVPHSFGTELAMFSGFADAGWNNQQISVIANPNNAYELYVPEMALPSDLTFTNALISKAITAVEMVTGGASPTSNTFSVTNLVVGSQYAIAMAGTTSWTSVGASATTVGTTFIAKAVGTGTGMVWQVPLVGDVLYFDMTTTAPTSAFTAADVAVGNTYTIASLGTTTTAMWENLGVSPVVAPAVGTTFIARNPLPGTIVLATTGTVNGTTASIQNAYKVVATPPNAFLLNANLAGAMNATVGPTYTAGISHIPFNDYIAKRRIYRAGGTTNFQLCKEMDLDQLSFLDALPDQGLGAVLPTLFTYNGVQVVVKPAPFGLSGMVMHYGIGFAWDPSSNRVVWTMQNQMDAWVPDFYKTFAYRILAIAELNHALMVFCEDGIYRADGTDPTMLVWNKTKAMPCRAGGSVQFLNNRLIYLGDQGLMSFNGDESTPLTDMRIPGDFWLANSGYLNSTDPQEYLVPSLQNASYERLRGSDLPSVTPRDLMPYMVSRDNQTDGIRSFIKYGKYYLYWGGDYPQFQAQTMLCVDFAAPGNPLTVIGIKAVDAFVDETERVHMILTYPST